MKKFAVLLAVVASLTGTPVHAQNKDNAGGYASRGAGANANRNANTDSFAWGACLGTLAILGTVVGLVASAATNGNSSN